MEPETVAERFRREAWEAGRLRGERSGASPLNGIGAHEGIREAVLELVKEIAPDRIWEFVGISGPHSVERAALVIVGQ